jgi:hypothetical protein
VLAFVQRPTLSFGIYHGGVIESHHELATGKPDSPDEVNRALDHLQGDKRLLVRTYLRFTGTEADANMADMPLLSELARYTWNGRKLDLVLSNWDPRGNMARWAKFIERALEKYGEYVHTVQICEEPNNRDYPGDGRYAHSAKAVLLGVQAASEKLRRCGSHALVGFNAVPNSDCNDDFWQTLADRPDSNLLEHLDYVGLNLYPDVLEPVVGEVDAAAEEMLVYFRERTLRMAGIPDVVPIHVSESGWPTGPQRFYTRQAEVLERILRRIAALKSRLNVRHFGLFSLRDADTANPDASRQFGIMRDDYTPKPSFEIYRKLIRELSN